MEVEFRHECSKLKNVNVTAPPKPKFQAAGRTTPVTNQEIAKYWRQKCMDEEDHLLAAIKAAARIRARNLSVSLLQYFTCKLLHEKKGGIDKLYIIPVVCTIF